MPNPVSGFSRFSKDEKIEWIIKNYFHDREYVRDLIVQYWNSDARLQQLHDEFIENTITNYYLPFGVAPNFLINNKIYTIPMAIEESSVVAAASKAAKFWLDRGGFKARVISTKKIGQVHFLFEGDKESLKRFFKNIKQTFIEDCRHLTANMNKRGGGIDDIKLVDKTSEMAHYYQLHATFETLDAMGANFINSCLEQFAKTLEREVGNNDDLDYEDRRVQIIMSILSNYVPECLVKAEVSCPVEELGDHDGIPAKEFADKFLQAVRIAEIEPYRAVTHNKGIMNGIDAVVLATGNDFRAIEAGAHAYAAKDGQYSSLTHATVKNGQFMLWMEIPLALGTVGGLTRLHPLVRFALDLLGQPTAQELMKIVAVAGLAQNYAAVSSLITTGIQRGHMKMHLLNILNEFKASEDEKARLVEYFKTNVVTHGSVAEALEKLRD